MNTNETAREARTRNLARLRKLTIGTAALSVAATSGFGWLAAMSTVSASTAATAYATTKTSTANASTSAAVTATAAPAVTSVVGTSHVASGGS